MNSDFFRCFITYYSSDILSSTLGPVTPSEISLAVGTTMALWSAFSISSPFVFSNYSLLDLSVGSWTSPNKGKKQKRILFLLSMDLVPSGPKKNSVPAECTSFLVILKQSIGLGFCLSFPRS